MQTENPLRMSKAELLEVVLKHNARLAYRCQHGHDGFSHKNCYKEKPGKEPLVGSFDIEASGLKANFAVMLSWCIKVVDKKTIWWDVLTGSDLASGNADRRIVESCIAAMEKCDRVVTQYGSRFDIPFVRTRALKWNIPFPTYGTLYHTDVWRIARNKLCLHSNRQDAIAEAILGRNIKTRIHPDIWQKVQFGSADERKKALAYVLDHNKKDVKQLEANYLKLVPFIKETRTSI